MCLTMIGSFSVVVKDYDALLDGLSLLLFSQAGRGLQDVQAWRPPLMSGPQLSG
jgi:hypothetical protein